MAYSKKVVDKFENTLNNPEAFKVGRFDPKDENVGTGMVGAPACGDVMKLQIKCEPKGNTHVIKDVKFKTYGCGSAIASSSELVEMLIGKTLEEAKAIKNIEIVEALESVSYTHLRAHETDSYLVCRLLLEKKKRKTKCY